MTKEEKQLVIVKIRLGEPIYWHKYHYWVGDIIVANQYLNSPGWDIPIKDYLKEEPTVISTSYMPNVGSQRNDKEIAHRIAAEKILKLLTDEPKKKFPYND